MKKSDLPPGLSEKKWVVEGIVGNFSPQIAPLPLIFLV